MVTEPKATNIFSDDIFSIFHIFPKLRICLFFFVYIGCQKDEFFLNKHSGITMHDFEYFGTQAHLLHQMLSQELFCSYNDKNKSEITRQKIPQEFHIHLVHPILHL